MRAMRLVLPMVCLVACDPLADADYVGEPMFGLEGSFATIGDHEPVGAIALMWQDAGSAGGPGVAATTVPVTIELASFKVAIPVPPPPEVRVRFADADVEIAEAYVVAVGSSQQQGRSPQGIDRGHVVVFASADVAAGTLAADYLGGPIPAGYHLRRFEVATPGTAQRELIERCVGRGSPRAACETRRAYQLHDSPDDDRLQIVVNSR